VGGRYDIGGVKMPFNTLKGLRDNRYRGGAVGFGFSYGYKWFFSDSWAIEATAGFGFVRFSYDLYSLGKDSSKTGEDKKEYAGPSKAAISIVDTIREWSCCHDPQNHPHRYGCLLCLHRTAR
jgi:hypothetical protein